MSKTLTRDKQNLNNEILIQKKIGVSNDASVFFNFNINEKKERDRSIFRII